MKKLFENWRAFEKEVLEEAEGDEARRRVTRARIEKDRQEKEIAASEAAFRERNPKKGTRTQAATGYTGNLPTGPRRIVKPGTDVYPGGESPGQKRYAADQVAQKNAGILMDVAKLGFSAMPMGLGSLLHALAGPVTRGSATSILGSTITSLLPTLGATIPGMPATGVLGYGVGGTATVGLLATSVLTGAFLGWEAGDVIMKASGIKDPEGLRNIGYKFLGGALGLHGDLTGHQAARLETAMMIMKHDKNGTLSGDEGMAPLRRHALVMLAVSEHKTGSPEHDKFKAELAAVLERDYQLSQAGEGETGAYYAKMMMHPRLQDSTKQLHKDVWSIATGTEAVGRVTSLMAMDTTISDEEFHGYAGRERTEEEITQRDSEVTKNLIDQLTDPSLRADTDVSDADALNNLVDFAFETGDTDTAYSAMAGEFTSSPSEGGTWEEKHAQDAQADQAQADYEELHYGDEASQSDTGPDEFGADPTSPSPVANLDVDPDTEGIQEPSALIDARKQRLDVDPDTEGIQEPSALIDARKQREVAYASMKEETKRKPKLSITKSRLAQIIKEELAGIKTESFFNRLTGNAGLTNDEIRIKTLTKLGENFDGSRGLKAEMVTLETGETGLQVTVPDDYHWKKKGETKFFMNWYEAKMWMMYGDQGDPMLGGRGLGIAMLGTL
jgi:hypothetical protein